MIISASRRTDIPAFYAEWMVRRLKEGYCTVANPFNRNQVVRISLKPEDVDAIVFWSRNPRPLMPHLDELDSRGYRYYFQFTILGYPREIDAKSPPAATAVEAFCKLAERLGPKRVIWRYDPIVFSGLTSPAFHEENFRRLAECSERAYPPCRRQHRGHVPEDREAAEDAGGDAGGGTFVRCRGLRAVDAQAGRTGGGERDGDRQLCRGGGSPTVRRPSRQVRGRPYHLRGVRGRSVQGRKTRPSARRAGAWSAGTSACTNRACSAASTATPPRALTRLG